MKWILKSKEKSDGLIRLKFINVVNGYTQVSVVDHIESLSPVPTNMSTRILIGLTFYHRE